MSTVNAPVTPTANSPLTQASWAAFRTGLREFAAGQLPDAMVPARFVVLPELPKLPNGKVDRGRLPAVAEDDTTGAAGYVAPQTPQEIQLAEIWADVLGVGRVGLKDNFFELGGDSLAGAQLAARLRAATGARISLRKLFDNPTVERLVRQLGAQDDTAAQAGGAGHPRSISGEDLAAEALLPADIVPAADALPASRGPYGCVLLTGGTGYTGAFLMRELLDRSGARLYVLVRSDSPEQAAARVRAAMELYGVWRDGDEKRFSGVPGDLARPYFGLDRETYLRLARDVEMIVHNGAWSSYALPYRRLKPVNVLGTQEVLRLAARHRVKPVHYISSLAVYPGRPGAHRWTEDAVAGPEGVVGGYRQTKWVGDRMMAQAHARGLPTCVYRPGQIAGAQTTGACATDTFLNATVKGCVQLGAALEFDVFLEMTPVDFCAATVAHVALGGQWHGTSFNLPGGHPLAWDRLVELLAECGHPLRRLPYADWYAELTAAAERGEENELARFLPLFGPDRPAEDLGYRGSRPVFETANLRAALAGSGIECLPPERELIGRYLDYFEATQFLPARAERTAP
ncbi:thioester reductase domain-containing protein [Streptomyces hokutonensis]|uniref:thioester reductase domain-containing protein n=1 Tax=Streptomyces hokutonensis TaxID=1306990 RepID=UPI0003635271|nr:thioester reductase domain-containing protein [Streptomyces hokutonensis]